MGLKNNCINRLYFAFMSDSKCSNFLFVFLDAYFIFNNIKGIYIFQILLNIISNVINRFPLGLILISIFNNDMIPSVVEFKFDFKNKIKSIIS